MKTLYALVLAGGSLSALAIIAHASTPHRNPTRKITNVALQAENGATELMVGGSLQVVAKATYSDGATANLPSQGDTVTAWSSTNYSIASIDDHGFVTALAPGPVTIAAMIGSVAAQPLVLLVSRPAIEEPAEPPAPETGAALEGPRTDDTVPSANPTTSESPGSTAPENPSTSTSPTASPTSSTQPESPIPQTPFMPVTLPQSALAGPEPAAPASPLPDNFIGPFWMTEIPSGGSASISNSHLFLGVPGGANHDPFSATNQAVRVVQSIGNIDFDVSMKVDSPLVAADGNTSQGLMVLAANGDFLTFALTTDGNNIGLMGKTVTAGYPTIVLDDSAFSEYQNPTYLRLRRSGSGFVALYSVDGATWKQAVSFTDTMVTASIGPFASNYSDTPANTIPVVMSVNWFEVQ